MNYQVIRPPLSPSFFLPSHEELLSLQKGDIVKIMLKPSEGLVERMWVIIDTQQDISEWTGSLDNEPLTEELKAELKAGTKILFHPLDIIQIYSG